MSKSNPVQALRGRARAPCPNCGRPSVRQHRPFCSARCADLDLGRWLTGRYRIPAVEGGEVADAEAGETDEG